MSTSDRVHLARSNVDLIAVALGKAIDAGAEADDVVVLLLDTRDHLARELATAIIENQGGLDLDAEEARVLNKGEIPTAISVVSTGLAELLFQETHPSVSSGLGRMPPGGCTRVVVVAGGGATLMHLPIASLAASGQG
jgi:hypothetical protein